MAALYVNDYWNSLLNTINVRIIRGGITCPRTSSPFRTRRLPSFEYAFWFTRQRKCEVWLDDERFLVETDGIVLLPPERTQTIRLLSGNSPIHHIRLQVRLLGAVDFFTFFRFPLSLSIPPGDPIEIMFKLAAGELQRCWNHMDNYGAIFYAKGLLSTILISLARKMIPSTPGETDIGSSIDIRVLEAVAYINGHLHETLVISALARQVNVHPSRLWSLFRTMTGQSPKTFILHARLNKAVELLATSALSVKEISQCVGIPDTCYLSRLFRHYKGYTPTQYRKQLLAQNE